MPAASWAAAPASSSGSGRAKRAPRGPFSFLFRRTRPGRPGGAGHMWRWTRRALAGLGGLLVAGAAAGATYQWLATRRDLAGQPPPGRLVGVGGHRLHIWCSGSGSPAVILENGLAGSTAGWGLVQPEVAGF